MNNERFTRIMRAVDDDLLEEAMQPAAKSGSVIWLRWAAAAACMCIAIGGIWAVHRGSGNVSSPIDSDPANLPASITMQNPVSENEPGNAAGASVLTAEDLAIYGYALALPLDAENTVYSIIELGDDYALPMAQATFTQNDQQYTCRALKTDQPEDISDMDEVWDESLDWSVDSVSLKLREASSGTAYVSWYSEETKTQWCLSTEAGGQAPVHTAYTILHSLGYNMAVAPKAAEDIAYDVFGMGDLIVAETAFTLDGVRCSYRTAATVLVEFPFADISGTGQDAPHHISGELGWCQAELFFTEGGEGKIIWFDIVPGLLYSLSVDSGASEQLLLDLANSLYTPAQSDVG